MAPASPAANTTSQPRSSRRRSLRAADAPTDAPRLPVVFEYTFTRRRIAEPIGTVRCPGDVEALLRDFVQPDETEQERLVVALLNAKHAVIGLELIYIGNASGSSVRVGEVFRAAVRLNASAIVVCHNHPSGDPAPSADDLAVTRDMAAAGRILDIELVDHMILGGEGRTASLRTLGHIR
jgi:DNA repair protein RadC